MTKLLCVLTPPGFDDVIRVDVRDNKKGLAVGCQFVLWDWVAIAERLPLDGFVLAVTLTGRVVGHAAQTVRRHPTQFVKWIEAPPIC